jgi:hypothetical protein
MLAELRDYLNLSYAGEARSSHNDLRVASSSLTDWLAGESTQPSINRENIAFFGKSSPGSGEIKVMVTEPRQR